MTQPTMGFGSTRPCPRIARARARPMKRSSCSARRVTGRCAALGRRPKGGLPPAGRSLSGVQMRPAGGGVLPARRHRQIFLRRRLHGQSIRRNHARFIEQPIERCRNLRIVEMLALDSRKSSLASSALPAVICSSNSARSQVAVDSPAARLCSLASPISASARSGSVSAARRR